MDAVIFLVIAIALLCGVAYLIGHTHGKSSAPGTIIVGAGSGGVPADATTAKPGSDSQAAS